MKVAILFSGGKDSVNAVALAKEKGWDIDYLLSVKPSRTDCYLFHYATVEYTKELAEIFGLKHILTGCDVADPEKEAEIIKNIVKDNPVDAVVLGGVGLQETQINSIRKALSSLGVEVFASHAEEDSLKLMNEMIKNGYEIVITEIASDGLTEEHIGLKLDAENFPKFVELSRKYGFEVLGEGGYYNTLVVDGPIFDKRLEIIDSEKVMESENVGYLKVNQVKMSKKVIQ